MLRPHALTTALFLLLASIVTTVHAVNENTINAARQTVEAYSKIEFEGAWVEDRWAMIKFSPKRKEENKYRVVTDSSVYQLGKHYPFIVIDSYDIQEIRVLSPARATAKVSYRRIAHSVSNVGRGWHLVADPKDNDLVTLNLVFEKNKWWVLDPPPPRISKEVLLEYYEYKIKHLEVENDPRWQNERDIVKLLKSLP